MNANPSTEQTPMNDPRVRLAAERTLLAWIRTGLAMMGFGFVVARFGLFLRELAAAGHVPSPTSSGVSLWIGTALVLLGVCVNVLAAVEHAAFLRRLRAGEPDSPPRLPLGLTVSALLALIGIGMTTYLILLGR